MIRIKKQVIFLGVLLSLALQAIAQSDLVTDITTKWKLSDSKGIAKYFDTSVEMDILSNEKIGPKAEAESILHSFFSRNPASSVKVVHRIDSKPDYKVIVMAITTNKGTFRATISMSNKGSGFLISEIRIEEGS